jgi:hypothetical protein
VALHRVIPRVQIEVEFAAVDLERRPQLAPQRVDREDRRPELVDHGHVEFGGRDRRARQQASRLRLCDRADAVLQFGQHLAQVGRPIARTASVFGDELLDTRTALLDDPREQRADIVDATGEQGGIDSSTGRGHDRHQRQDGRLVVGQDHLEVAFRPPDANSADDSVHRLPREHDELVGRTDSAHQPSRGKGVPPGHRSARAGEQDADRRPIGPGRRLVGRQQHPAAGRCNAGCAPPSGFGIE